MWDRVKRLLTSKGDTLGGDGELRQSMGQSTPEHLTRQLRSIDESVEAGELIEGLGKLRALLCDYPARAEVLQRAAVVLDRVDEGKLASLFEDAMGHLSAESMSRLANTFCDLNDSSIAMAFAGAARRLGGPEDAFAAAALARVLARDGHHQDVLGVLERFEGRWSSDAMLHAYATAAILTGDSSRWNRVASSVSQTQDGPSLVRAAARVGTFGWEATGSHALRHSHFIQYGSTLIEGGRILPSMKLRAGSIAQNLELTVTALQAARVKIDRFAFGTQRGDVLARWLGSLMDTPAMPVSSRIPGQRVAFVVVDDDDLLEAIQRNTQLEAPAVFIQLIRDPGCTVTPVADIIGFLGSGVELPFGDEIGGALGRIPPSILVKKLQAQAALDRVEPSSSDLHEWVSEHVHWLSLVDPPPLSGRLEYGANIPAWVRSPKTRESAIQESRDANPAELVLRAPEATPPPQETDPELEPAPADLEADEKQLELGVVTDRSE